MTAEEREKRARTTIDLEGDFDCYIFSPEELEGYKDQLCKDQKKLCAKQIHNGTTVRNSEMVHAIRNAPKPTGGRG